MEHNISYIIDDIFKDYVIYLLIDKNLKIYIQFYHLIIIAYQCYHFLTSIICLIASLIIK